MEKATVAYRNALDFAQKMDDSDPLKAYRDEFYFPQMDGKTARYFTGNSLGLQPKSARKYVEEELEDWAKFGVEGHFEARRNWFGYHHYLTDMIAEIAGAKPTEVVAMNSLSVNLNLLMISFYQPKDQRTKIVMEASAFPSDHYAVQQQVKFHGFNPEEHIILLQPSQGKETIDTEDIIRILEANKNEIALVMLGGVNYYTGQFFDLERITQKAHEIGAKAGYDLAHAAGNVVLKLHDWNVDFACWCGYKYLNSGPGGISSIFVHERYAEDFSLPRLAGWWGHNEKDRFLMDRKFSPQIGAAGWQMSNAQILPMAVHLASLEIFHRAGMTALRQKSEQLTGYLEFLLSPMAQISMITPKNSAERGCQLSLVAKSKPKELFQFLKEKGIIADWREPDVIRVAPVPLYNSFEDVWILADTIAQFYS